MNGIKPSSNLLLKSRKDKHAFWSKRNTQLGLFSQLNDRCLVNQVLCFLDEKDLAKLGRVSDSFNKLCAYEQLWKTLYILKKREKPALNFWFKGSWKNLFIREPTSKCKDIYYSDFLYKPYLYKFSDELQNEIAFFSKKCTCIGTLKFESLTTKDFVTNYEQNRIPVKILNSQNSWRVHRDWSIQEPNRLSLGQESMSQATLNTTVRVGELNVTLSEFLQYSEHCQNEECKLYFFDCNVLKTSKHFKNLYTVPDIFKDRDLFDSLRQDRPDNAWIIAGAKHSYSKWHIDPNYTHAWNAVTSGKKLWLMLPFECVPCGVHPTQDLTSVRQPISLAEWFSTYFEATINTYGTSLHFTVAEPGSIVFIPCRFWHCVVNLRPTVAITQNYISTSNLFDALKMMKFKPELISGLPYSRDKTKLYDELINALDSSIDHHSDNEISKIINITRNYLNSSKWERIKRENNDNFCFSFFTNT